MTCDICKSWYAKSEKQHANRLHNMAGAPGAQSHPCPKCGGIDWATSRKMIPGVKAPKVLAWFATLSSWRWLCTLNAVLCICAAVLAITSADRWSGLVDAAVAGFAACGVIHACRMMIMEEALDKVRDAFSAMVALNDQLMQAKVEAVIFRDDDGAPIAPETRH